MNSLQKDKNLIFFPVLLSSIAFWGAVVYRVYALNTKGVIITGALVVASLLFYLFFYKNKENNFSISDPTDKKYSTRILAIAHVLYLASVSACFLILVSKQTSSALISPWQVVPAYFFLVYFIATLLLLFIIHSKAKISLFYIIVHYFLSSTVALIIYRIGYGFDPFIHQATMELIDKNGVVTPKPFYYLGQYSLIIFIHKITTISIPVINKILVPLTGALLLPASIFLFLQKWFRSTEINLILTLTALIFPFSFLIMTTPQNLSYILLLTTLLFGLSYPGGQGLAITYLLALATLSLHPITGIPAVILSLVLTIRKSSLGANIKKYLYAFFFLLTSASLPLAFYLLGLWQTDKSVVWQWQSIIPSFGNLVPGKEDLVLNFIYMYGHTWKIWLAILVGLGIFIAVKNQKRCKPLLLSLIVGSGLVISYIVTRQLSFTYLIEYERNGYADRILVVAALVLSPFLFISLYSFFEKLLPQKRTVKIPFLVFIGILISTSLYLSYPRFDHYHNSRGYSASEQTLEAVNWIEDTASRDYIVLANQQVGVSALLQFGFDRYHRNDIYFYPLPTSGRLYGYYLDMVYDSPSREVMRKAVQYAGVDTGYFVLNKYWWAFPKILEEAKMEADNIKEIGDGEIYIFEYSF
jgi:hypothetical protein